VTGGGAQDAHFILEDAAITDWNDSAAHILHLSDKSELVGRRSPTSRPRASLVHPPLPPLALPPLTSSSKACLHHTSLCQDLPASGVPCQVQAYQGGPWKALFFFPFFFFSFFFVLFGEGSWWSQGFGGMGALWVVGCRWAPVGGEVTGDVCHRGGEGPLQVSSLALALTTLQGLRKEQLYQM